MFICYLLHNNPLAFIINMVFVRVAYNVGVSRKRFLIFGVCCENTAGTENTKLPLCRTLLRSELYAASII